MQTNWFIAVVYACLLQSGAISYPSKADNFHIQPLHESTSEFQSEILWLDELEIDLGDIQKDSAITQVFRFKNQSDAAVQIDNVRTSCGCTAGDWENEPTPSGEIGMVRLTFDAAKRGYFRKRATVWFRGVRRPSRLVLAGKVV